MSVGEKMNKEKIIKNWQQSISSECAARLGRKLTEKEQKFIDSRGKFAELEIMESTLKTLSVSALDLYLNSKI